MRNTELKRLIKEAGFTQGEFARHISISQFDLSRAINGRLVLRLYEKISIALALDKSVGELFEE